MKYIVIELQTDAAGNVANIVNQYDSLSAAESAYYSILSAAAISSVPIHSAVVLDSEGMPVYFHSFKHGEVS